MSDAYIFSRLDETRRELIDNIAESRQIVNLDSLSSARYEPLMRPGVFNYLYTGAYSMYDTLPINPCQELQVINPLSDVEEV